MKLKQIASSREIIECSCEKGLSPCDLGDSTETQDECVRLAFGDNVADAMQECLKVYSSVEGYDPDKNYEEGDVIKFDGYLLEATVDNPGDPSCESGWKSPDKFTKECLNELWCDWGLCSFVSHSVLIDKLVCNALPFTKMGLGFRSDSALHKPSSDDIKLKKSSYYSKLNRSQNRVKRYLDKNPSCVGGNEHVCASSKCDCGSSMHNDLVESQSSGWVMS